MGKWMDGRISGWMMDKYVVNGWVDGWASVQWMGGWIDKWADGRMECIKG